MSVDVKVRAIWAAARQARDVAARFSAFAESLEGLAGALDAEIEPPEMAAMWLRVMEHKRELLGAVQQLDRAALPLGRKN